MTEATPTPRPAYFDNLYRRVDDPWGLETRFYEQRKRDLVVASLPRPRFERAFEPGCAAGALTLRLAQRCDAVVACDLAGRAVDLSRARVPHNVVVEHMAFPAQRPPGHFDLIIISEMGYYCPNLLALSQAVDELLTPSGVLVACHWRHSAVDHPHTAEVVHETLSVGRRLVARHVEEDFLLDVWSVDGVSVARADGIV